MNLSIRFAGLLLLLGQAVTGQRALAQTEKGVGWYSGGVGWERGRTDLFQNSEELSTLNVSLTQGTFLRDNLLVGADLRLTRFSDLIRQGFNFEAVSDSRQTVFGATPFVRRFWGKEAVRGYVGGGVAVLYGSGKLLTTNTQQRVSEQESTQWQLSPEFQAGVLYTINPRWGLELSARSGLFPIALTNLNLGLVILSGVKQKKAALTDILAPPQLMRANWLLGGTFELGSNQQQLTSGSDKLTTIQRQTSRQFTISPSVGYMAGNRWVVGVAVPIRKQELINEFNRSSNDTQTGSVLTNSIGVEPYAKKYFSKAQFGPFVAGRVGWRSERISGDGTAPSKATGYTWRLSGGLAYMLGTHFIVEGEVFNMGSEWSDVPQTGDTRNNTSLSISLRPAIAMTYVIW